MVRKQQKWILPDVKAQPVTFDKMYRQLSTNGEAFEPLVMESTGQELKVPGHGLIPSLAYWMR